MTTNGVRHLSPGELADMLPYFKKTRGTLGDVRGNCCLGVYLRLAGIPYTLREHETTCGVEEDMYVKDFFGAASTSMIPERYSPQWMLAQEHFVDEDRSEAFKPARLYPRRNILAHLNDTNDDWEPVRDYLYKLQKDLDNGDRLT